ncbi:hypothetical protein B0H16DRAFT_1331123 [Mycena metata]|uniref:Complex 1 LYR protein domain-containing protein n=1 Tax=Mycena metata TaxID=1033252 RepID=A0AAD7HTM6_9AGAR|nr:hypothetical protein B0H16DRAFT_1331123 [Mycena metata]
MALTLRHFILKQQVFNLYRYAIRSSPAIPDPLARRETIKWIRAEFERNRISKHDAEKAKRAHDSSNWTSSTRLRAWARRHAPPAGGHVHSEHCLGP